MKTKKINLTITGCLGRMGQQLIKSASKDKRFKINSLTEDKLQRKKILGIPSYADPGRLITEGGVYHVMMYGLNSMGSYASQTNQEERWMITQHVMNLKAALEGTPLLEPESEIK